MSSNEDVGAASTPTSWRVRGLRVLLLLLGLIIPLLAAEHLLPKPRADLAGTIVHRIPHPVRGWAPEPGSRCEQEFRDGIFHVVYNSDGWRDVEHAELHASASPRVVVLGDSFMEAYSVSLDDAFHRQLADRLSRGGQAVTTVNLGVGGYSTLQSLLAWREVGPPFSPSLVLLGFYVDNDVSDNSAELQSMFGHRNRVDSRPFIDPTRAEWRVIQPDYEESLAVFEELRDQHDRRASSLVARSSLAFAVESAADRIKDMLAAFAGSSPEQRTRKWRSAMARNGVEFCEEPTEYTAAWDVTRRILERLDAEVTANGAQLVVFSVPALHDVHFDRVVRHYTAALEPTDLCLEAAPGHARLKAMLDELDIEFIDLLGPFRSAFQEEGIELFRASDRHWNASGHALAAETVARALEARGAIPLERRVDARRASSPAHAESP